MEKVTQTAFQKQACNSNAFSVYKIAKKIIKHSFCATHFHFAYEAFMDWD